MFQAACHHDSPFHGKNIQQGSWISHCWALGSEVSSFIVELHLCHLSNTFTMQKGSFFRTPLHVKNRRCFIGGSISLWFFLKNEQFRLQWFICWIPITDLEGWSFDTHPGLGGNRWAPPPKVCNFDSPLASQVWFFACWGDRFMDVDVFNWNVFILLLCNYVELVYMIYNVYCAYSLYIIYIITYIKFQMRASNIFLGGRECMMKVTGSILVGPASDTCHW